MHFLQLLSFLDKHSIVYGYEVTGAGLLVQSKFKQFIITVQQV